MEQERYEFDVWIEPGHRQADLAMRRGARWDRHAQSWYAPAGSLKAFFEQWAGDRRYPATAVISIDHRCELARDIENAVRGGDAPTAERCASAFWEISGRLGPWTHWGRWHRADAALLACPSAPAQPPFENPWPEHRTTASGPAKPSDC